MKQVTGVRRPTSAPGSPQRPASAGGLRVTAVLVPAGGNGGHKTAPTRPSEPAGKPAALPRSLKGTLTSLFRGWDSRAPIGSVEALVQATNQAQEQADALDQQRGAGAGGSPSKAPPGSELLPDIRSFLRPVGVMEARYVRVLSSLCAMTYNLDKLTPSSLLRRHRLQLVSTSKVCDARLREPRLRPADALSEGDAMAAHPGIVAAVQVEIAAGAARALAAPSPVMATVARVAPLSTVDFVGAATGMVAASPAPAVSSSNGGSDGEEEAWAPAAGVLVGADDGSDQSPVDRVAASLAAASAAAAAAGRAAYTAAVPYAGPLANNITAFTTSALTSALPPVRSVAAQLQTAAAVGHSSAIATVATVMAALESTWMGRPDSTRLPKDCQSPTEWFIADDPASHTRYIVIQGSDNLDHWRVNLTFDPVPFEEPALQGVKVHRGVYETAEVLYERFLPLVQDHLASSPFAKIAFTGHSLGGSLGTLLMLMYVRRGVLPKSAISPVYTFGAPAVFCEGGATGGASGCDDCSQAGDAPAQAQQQQQAAACGISGGGGGVLGLLGLPDGAVRNVLMHRDIVPRAFACDYTLVADLLKRVSESFREHRCLNSNRTVMFNFIGKMMVLQPSADASFVYGEGNHPLLPPVPGLYVVREPVPALNSVTATLKQDASFVQQAVAQAISNLPAAGAASTAGSAAAHPAAAAGASGSSRPRADTVPLAKQPQGKPPAKQQQQLAPLAKQQQPAGPVTSAREAVWVLMNAPHPLDILADPGAYGDLGAISRYHNPDNYTKALGGVLRHRQSWRRLATRAGEAGIRWFAPSLDPSQLRAAAAAQAADAASAAPAAAPAAADRRHHSSGGKQSLRVRLSPRGGSGLPHSGSSGQLV